MGINPATTLSVKPIDIVGLMGGVTGRWSTAKEQIIRKAWQRPKVTEPAVLFLTPETRHL